MIKRSPIKFYLNLVGYKAVSSLEYWKQQNRFI